VLVPVLAVMGAAVDYSGMANRKAKIQSSADIAILAAAKDSGSINEFYDLAENYLAANLPGVPIKLEPRTYPDKVSLAISSPFPTSFLAMVGIADLNIEVVSELSIEKFGTGSTTNGTLSPALAVSQLEFIRDQLIRQAGDLPPRELERVRKKIRSRFDRLIRSAEQSGTPIHLSR
jgi:uncharacterized membrane protein